MSPGRRNTVDGAGTVLRTGACRAARACVDLRYSLPRVPKKYFTASGRFRCVKSTESILYTV
mgnify:CR=1 FL=1